MSIKGNNEPPAQHHQCSCLVLSRHLSSLYRPLGHFDNITVLSVSLELQDVSETDVSQKKMTNHIKLHRYLTMTRQDRLSSELALNTIAAILSVNK